MMSQWWRAVIVSLSLLLSSCRIEVSTTLRYSDVLYDRSILVASKVTLYVDECSKRESERYVLGTVAKFKGCFHSEGETTEIWEISTPIIPPNDAYNLRSAPYALFYGKNHSLIVYVNQDTLTDIRRVLGGNSSKISFKFGFINDTNSSVDIGVSNVWVDNIPVGQTLSLYQIPPDNSVMITLSDTAVGSLLRIRSEPVMIAPVQ